MVIKLSRSFVLLYLIVIIHISQSKKSGKEKPAWAKKDIRDYNDADLERLYDQWE
ncbi:LDLR chaperone boca, partial [Stegodyphus mimosarum]